LKVSHDTVIDIPARDAAVSGLIVILLGGSGFPMNSLTSAPVRALSQGLPSSTFAGFANTHRLSFHRVPSRFNFELLLFAALDEYFTVIHRGLLRRET
jgi:hypothetical protein